jgi:hypothetical protein
MVLYIFIAKSDYHKPICLFTKIAIYPLLFYLPSHYGRFQSELFSYMRIMALNTDKILLLNNKA